MSDLPTSALPVSILKPLPAPAATSTGAVTGNEAAKRAHIDKAAKDYESAFLSIMLGQMMSGVKTTTFGGGEGEDAFKSFMTDAMAKSIVKHGGVGLSKNLSASMLKLQGLSQTPVPSKPATPAGAESAAPSQSAPAHTVDIAA